MTAATAAVVASACACFVLGALAAYRILSAELSTERELRRAAEAERDQALHALARKDEACRMLALENEHLSENNEVLGRQLSGWSSLPRRERRFLA